MKKLISLCIISLLLNNAALAGGGMTHMFVAAESITKLTDKNLRDLLLNNMDAYLVGAYYPDSGFAKGTHYGEDSHWNPFLYTFADYLNEKYSDPIVENPKLVAFLFGCASHSVSDIVLHKVFYYDSAAHDFNNDWKAAHVYGDIGIDLLIDVDKNQWFTYPREWWIPVSDLVEVYRRMGKPQYTAEEIIHGNKTIAVAGFEERAIAVPAYPVLRWWKMPWTATHYYNYEHGGLVNAENEAAKYQMQLWDRIRSGTKSHRHNTLKQPDTTRTMDANAILDLAKDTLEAGAIIVSVHENADGSVNMDTPVVTNEKKLKELVEKFVEWLRGLNPS